MPSEVKFRAWDKFRLTMYQVAELHLYPDFPEHSGVVVWNKKGELLRRKRPLCDVVLLQYIGQRDERGQDIYEGHILRDSKGQHGRVFSTNHQAGFLVNWKMKDGTYETDSCLYGRIVGNAYENPELC